jgi:hypothetical protein
MDTSSEEECAKGATKRAKTTDANRKPRKKPRHTFTLARTAPKDPLAIGNDAWHIVLDMLHAWGILYVIRLMSLSRYMNQMCKAYLLKKHDNEILQMAHRWFGIRDASDRSADLRPSFGGVSIMIRSLALANQRTLREMPVLPNLERLHVSNASYIDDWAEKVPNLTELIVDDARTLHARAHALARIPKLQTLRIAEHTRGRLKNLFGKGAWNIPLCVFDPRLTALRNVYGCIRPSANPKMDMARLICTKLNPLLERVYLYPLGSPSRSSAGATNDLMRHIVHDCPNIVELGTFCPLPYKPSRIVDLLRSARRLHTVHFNMLGEYIAVLERAAQPGQPRLDWRDNPRWKAGGKVISCSPWGTYGTLVRERSHGTPAAQVASSSSSSSSDPQASSSSSSSSPSSSSDPQASSSSEPPPS